LNQVLASLSHSVRRRIITLLAASGGLSYGELLNRIGVESSMLSFHLKKLRDLVEKGPDGLYRLSGLGRRAVGIIECIQSGESGGYTVRGVLIYVVGDDVLLESYKRGGLLIEDVGVIVFLNVSRSLLSKSLKVVRRVLAVYTPLEVLEVVESRIIDVEAIVPYRGRIPVSFDKPMSIVEDLESRGFKSTAGKLASLLGSTRT